jgi:mannose-1-phosphate guanylyltransferase/mannose-6-phosphate isomerase
MIIPVILAGGSGTRLWPLSRKYFPKQLLNLTDGNTLLQNTLLRLEGVPEIGAPMVICNEAHRFMVAEQLRSIGQAAGAIILEPIGRNTAPAVAVAAIKALAAHDDPTLLVLPADHVIAQRPVFHDTLVAGIRYAARGHLTTFGIIPSAPETGYGYIRKGAPLPPLEDAPAFRASAIAEFVEKPDLETAQAYLASGEYCWNSGMFVFRAKQVLEELGQHAPDMITACRRAVSRGRDDLDFFRLDPPAFQDCPSDSLDYAVMEKTRHGAMVPLDAGWNDLGSWEALWQVGTKDDCGNVLQGDVLVQDVGNSLVRASKRLVAAVGLENHIVVETADAVLVSPRDRVQEVKAIVDDLNRSGRWESQIHRTLYRPWGTAERLEETAGLKVSRITINPGAKLSLQKHFHRSEHWIVTRGEAEVTKGDQTLLLKEEESTFIPVGVVHRLANPGRIALEMIEVQTGSTVRDDDIERLEDLYGRNTSR